MFGAAGEVRRSIGVSVCVPDVPSHERTEEALRTALGVEVYRDLLTEGARLSVEEWVDVAAALAPTSAAARRP